MVDGGPTDPVVVGVFFGPQMRPGYRCTLGASQSPSHPCPSDGGREAFTETERHPTTTNTTVLPFVHPRRWRNCGRRKVDAPLR